MTNATDILHKTAVAYGVDLSDALFGRMQVISYSELLRIKNDNFDFKNSFWVLYGLCNYRSYCFRHCMLAIFNSSLAVFKFRPKLKRRN